jgi:hypothetical protein
MCGPVGGSVEAYDKIDSDALESIVLCAMQKNYILFVDKTLLWQMLGGKSAVSSGRRPSPA